MSGIGMYPFTCPACGRSGHVFSDGPIPKGEKCSDCTPKPAYKPTPHDVAWMKALVASLTLGGVWGYKDQPILFKKTEEKTMALVTAPFGDARMDEEIARNKAVMAEAGITFVDQRKKS